MKKIALFVLLFISIFSLNGCASSSRQFKEPKKGETVAEIKIRDSVPYMLSSLKKKHPRQSKIL